MIDEEREAEVNSEFRERTKGFTPAFGNMKHKQALELITANNRKIQQLKDEMSHNPRMVRLREDIMANKVKINYLLDESI